MAKRKPLPRLTTDEKVQRLLRRDQTLYEMDDPGYLDRRPPMAGASYARSLMDTEMGSDPAKIEARARMIAKMRADAERERIDDLVRRGLVQEYKVREKPPTTADMRPDNTMQVQQVPGDLPGVPNFNERIMERLRKQYTPGGGTV